VDAFFFTDDFTSLDEIYGLRNPKSNQPALADFHFNFA
jgi:hypothetical protein